MGDRGERGNEAENIKVVLRVRPFNETERGRGDRAVLRCLDDGRSVQVSSFGMEDFGRSSSVKNFSFTACIGEDCDQESFYEQSGVSGLIGKALDGYSATLFAYGQTGSGKTYSVSGAEHVIVDDSYQGGDPREGVVPRAAREIYQAVQEEHGGATYSVKAACFEIYNEQVLDLLNPEAGQLAIRESKAQGFFVENLLVVECHSVSDLMEVFKEGMRNRHVGAHAMNRDSSRSHSLLVLYIDTARVDPETGEEVKQFGKLAFVDLAGSERLKTSGSSGEMTKETGQINKSLFTLGKVIASLDKGEAFVPYRDSKLTKLLMDSLGGSSTCVMVACCSPSARYIEETLSTLSYASRALNITNTPVVQLEPAQRLILALRHDNQMLRAENAQLRLQLGLPLSEKVRPSSAALKHAALLSASAGGGLVRNPKETGNEDEGGAGTSRGRMGSSRSGSRLRLAPCHTTSGHHDASPVPAKSKAAAESAQLYDKAVGYAQGYAAGLDQAKEVLAAGGLDLGAHDLHCYDLSHPGGAPAWPSGPGAHKLSMMDGAGMPASSRGSSRLPPLPLQRLEAEHPSLQLSQEQVTAAVAHMSTEELQQQVLHLHAAHGAAEKMCTGLRAECLRLQDKLDEDALRSRPPSHRLARPDQALPTAALASPRQMAVVSSRGVPRDSLHMAHSPRLPPSRASASSRDRPRSLRSGRLVGSVCLFVGACVCLILCETVVFHSSILCVCVCGRARVARRPGSSCRGHQEHGDGSSWS